MSPESIQRFIRQCMEQLPEGLKSLPEDVKEKLKQHMQNTLARMDLVTREEFEVQTAVLERTRAKLEQLECKINQMSQDKEDE